MAVRLGGVEGCDDIEKRLDGESVSSRDGTFEGNRNLDGNELGEDDGMVETDSLADGRSDGADELIEFDGPSLVDDGLTVGDVP